MQKTDMKRRLRKLAAACAMAAGLAAFACAPAEAGDAAGDAPDYSKESSWLRLPKAEKDVDTFYVYATNWFMEGFRPGAPDYAPFGSAEMRSGAEEECEMHASAFADSTNVFAPFYRQAGMPAMERAWKETGSGDAAISGIPYADVSAALDWYFVHLNQGRPFIIAGHSQGSALVKHALKRYFKEHPEYFRRMVAAYVIGYAVTKDDLEKNPHLKFASGESDAGVIVSWNTEGPENARLNAPSAVLLPGGVSINPLNWKLDETYAPAGENPGSLMVDEKAGTLGRADRGADAQINLARGSVVTHAKASPQPEEARRICARFFGPDARHEDDYLLFYESIKANAAKRIASYRKSAK